VKDLGCRKFWGVGENQRRGRRRESLAGQGLDFSSVVSEKLREVVLPADQVSKGLSPKVKRRSSPVPDGDSTVATEYSENTPTARKQTSEWPCFN